MYNSAPQSTEWRLVCNYFIYMLHIKNVVFLPRYRGLNMEVAEIIRRHCTNWQQSVS